ncbi:MAG: TldD/PmbA family protein [Candidatus Ranarchaeia archaeon]
MDITEACKYVITHSPKDIEVEVWGYSSKFYEIGIDNSSIRRGIKGNDKGISVRIIKNNTVGTSYETKISKDNLKKTLKNAISIASSLPKDPRKVFLPKLNTEKYPKIRGIFDKKITSMEIDSVLDFSTELISNLSSNEGVILSGGVDLGEIEYSIQNSNGICAFEKSTIFQVDSTVKLTKDNDIGVGFDRFTSTHWEPKKAYDIVPKSEKKASNYLGAKSPPQGKFSVLLRPFSTGIFFSSIASTGCNGLQILRKKSYFVDKLNKKISSPEINLIDDGIYDFGVGSAGFDDEGVKKQRTILIENGHLKKFLNDTYTANALNQEPTGSSNRSSYSSPARITTSNLQLETGTEKEENIIQDLKEGILIDYALISPDSASGIISSKILYGLYIKNGEIKFPIKNTMLGSDVHTFLNNIKSISKEFKNDGGRIFPSILVDEVSISS